MSRACWKVMLYTGPTPFRLFFSSAFLLVSRNKLVPVPLEQSNHIMPPCNPSAASCSISNFEAQVPCCLGCSSSIINSAVCPHVKNNQTICQGGDFAGLNSCLSNTTMDFECNASTSGSGITLQKNLGSLKLANMQLLALSACFANAQ